MEKKYKQYEDIIHTINLHNMMLGNYVNYVIESKELTDIQKYKAFTLAFAREDLKKAPELKRYLVDFLDKWKKQFEINVIFNEKDILPALKDNLLKIQNNKEIFYAKTNDDFLLKDILTLRKLKDKVNNMLDINILNQNNHKFDLSNPLIVDSMFLLNSIEKEYNLYSNNKHKYLANILEGDEDKEHYNKHIYFDIDKAKVKINSLTNIVNDIIAAYDKVNSKQKEKNIEMEI